MTPTNNTLWFTLLLVVTITATAFSFTTTTKSSFRTSKTRVYENFGVDFAEDQAENTPDIILGEANLKQWVGTVNDNSFLNRQYNVIRRVRENGILGKTVEYGILSKLEDNGVGLVQLEGLLPLLEKLGLLSFAANNQQLLINGAAPLLIEPAPFLLPAIGTALGIGPLAFFAGAGATAALEAGLVINQVKVPFVGLPADILLGLVLVPVTALLAGVGLTLAVTGSDVDFDKAFSDASAAASKQVDGVLNKIPKAG